MTRSLFNSLCVGLLTSLVQGQTTSSAGAPDGLSVSASATTTTASLTSATVNGTVRTYAPQFTVPAEADIGASLIPNINDPQAVDAQTVCPGYTASNVQQNANGFSASLALAGQPCNVYGTDVDSLSLTVEYQSKERLSINISPSNVDASNSSWYILPESLVPRPSLDTNATGGDYDLQVTWSNDPTFSFKVTRNSTGDVLFSTEGSVLVYEDQFIEFVTTMPDNYNTYGLGEHIHGLRLGNNYTATLYAADAGDPIDQNIYGSHPFYLDTRYFEDSGSGNLSYVSNASDASATYTSYSHGVFLRNAHGQEILLKPTNITWRTLGGSIDLFFFSGPSATEVTQQYQFGAVGLPALQQYFTFGYHQCRWGYANWSEVEDVVNNFADFGLYLENIWTDIDYMFQYRDFDNDPIRYGYPEGEAFLARLHANGQHYIPIVDSAIYIPNPDNASDAYSTYDRGHAEDVFLLNPDGSEYIGSVWPGYTVFPDWHAEESVPWWTNEVTTWHDKIPFDGIWIDMSEVSSFCVGSCGSRNLSQNPVHPPFLLPGEPCDLVVDYPEGFNTTNATDAAAASSLSSSQASACATSTATSSASTSYLRTTPTPGVRNVDHPPYVINNVQGDLAVHAVAPNATHHDGVEEYDVHNLWGHQILNATYQALLNVFPGKRPFIIGRSTFAGSGKWAGHWGGDNTSKWYYMFFSIPQGLSFSLFGIPMFGVDTCGFNGNTDEELCNRWMQLSAFFPFYRNHNTLSANSQEPYVWASVAAATKTAQQIRYSILPYIYTAFYHAHTTGSTVMRALAWEFPNEPALASADRQYLLGPALLVTPVLEQGATSVNGVFPGTAAGQVWYDFYTQTSVNVSAGANITIPAPLGHIPLFVRGGYIIPRQEPRNTTTASRQQVWGLLVALDNAGSAKGSLYLDDGESLEPEETLLVSLKAANGSLSATGEGSYGPDENALAIVSILGVAANVSTVTFNDKPVSFVYSAQTSVLNVTGAVNETVGGAWKDDWVIKWS